MGERGRESERERESGRGLTLKIGRHHLQSVTGVDIIGRQVGGNVDRVPLGVVHRQDVVRAGFRHGSEQVWSKESGHRY